MQLFENIAMALASVRSNKMRSLLTMLGIIIGIAAVIAIETIGSSMTGEINDSMSGMGASNITVSLTQKSSGDNAGTAEGVVLRRFMDTAPADSDLITTDMIDEFCAAFPAEVDHIELTQQAGDGSIAKYGDPNTTIKTSVAGINKRGAAAAAQERPHRGGPRAGRRQGRRAQGGPCVGKVRAAGHRRQQL